MTSPIVRVFKSIIDVDIKINKMELNKKIIITSIALLIVLSGYSQRIPLPINNCPGESSSAEFRVELFLTLANRENIRQESGTTNETVDQIAVVEDEQVCSSLKNLISNNQKYNQINQSMAGTDNQIYFYNTNNFYYVFWNKKPEFDGIPRTGPKTLFLVIKKDLSQVWEYYL